MDSQYDNKTNPGFNSERASIGDGIVVRRLADSDSIRELTSLIHDAYAGLSRMNLHFLAATQDEAVLRRRMEGGECWVAEAEGRLVGTILFHPPVSTGTGWYGRPNAARFCQFAVAPSAQGAGIGTRLLEGVERRGREMGAWELACDTAAPAKHLVHMYRRRGYRRVDCICWPNTKYYSVVLSKSIGIPPRTPPVSTRLFEHIGFYYRVLRTVGMRRADGKTRWWVRVLKTLKQGRVGSE